MKQYLTNDSEKEPAPSVWRTGSENVGSKLVW